MKWTEEQKRVFSEMGKRGGKARAKRMTKKQRTDAARKAINARWAKVGR